jgi:hydrophobic/amphiphilic exporter-1 (mainly G- bacteria), HAE1 family
LLEKKLQTVPGFALYWEFNCMTFLSRISLANRSLVALATIAILFVGALVIPSLKQELYPSLEFPAVTVTAQYPGASPSIVEQNVTDPLEQSIQGTSDIQSLTSYSNQGASVIIVEYNFGTDLNQASQNLSQQLSRIQATLPAGVTPSVQTFNIDDLPVIQLAVTSNEALPLLAADLNAKVVPQLTGLSGVASVSVTGVQNQIVKINLNAKQMVADGITLLALQTALISNNISLPAGQLNANGQTLPITVSNSFSSLADLQNLVVGVKSNCPKTATSVALPTAPTCATPATPIALSDIATVEQAVAPSTSLTRTNGQPSLGIAITKSSDGNTVSISNAVRDQITALQNQLGNGAQITIISDQAPSITSAVTGLVREGLIGAAFAILVILLFLFSIRSTLVTAISIPLSIVIALIGLSIGQLTLNLFTLGALTIAVGRVVDDSIVVLENIYRHLNNGDEKRVAIPDAVREVAGAVTASTLTTVAVFLPIAFTGGLIGEVFGPFAITVTIALLASLFVALTIIPVLAYWFLKTPDEKAAAEAREQHTKETFLERGYIPLVNWVTAHKVVSLLVAFVLFFGSLAVIPRLGTNFFSSSQQNVYTLSETLPVGTSLNTTSTDAQQVETVLQNMGTQVQTYQVTIGSGGTLSALSGASGGTSTANFSITADPNIDQTAFQQTLQSRLNSLSGVGTLQLAASSGGFNSSGIAVDVQAPDQNTLEQATKQVLGVVSKASNVTNVTSNLAAASPLISVAVNPTKAGYYGVSASAIQQFLSLLYNGNKSISVNFNGSQESVYLAFDTIAPTTVAELQNLPISTSSGGIVLLGTIASVTQDLGPTQITHIAGQRTATVSATATTNNVGGITTQIEKQLKDLQLPAGATYSMGGEAQSQSQAFSSLGLALLIAILLVYLVMVGTFRSLVQPLVLLVSIPFAATGSLLLMLITHTELGVPSLIGLLMLIGIVVTNAIVLLDLVRQYRARGMDARTAVIEGGRRRLRPILMTAIATILALLPMALGLSKDSGFIAAPLAITVIGGLATSTVLTLLLVPTLYVMIESRNDGKPGPNDPLPATPLPVEEQVTSKQEVIQGA